MGNIYRNLREIPIPEDGRINNYDGKVSVYYRDALNHRRRHVIGLATSQTTMQPNDNFRFLYPELWAKYYEENNVRPYLMHAGLYALGLGIGWQTGLYPIVQEAFGPEHGNAFMDYALFNIKERSCSSQLFEGSMRSELHFSLRLPTDSWLSELFGKSVTGEQIHAFRLKWLQRCRDLGAGKVWLCIDGTNNDCALRESRLAKPGQSKSHKSLPIVGFITAVSTLDGMPVTWFVHNGGMPDCKAFDVILRLLASSGLQIEGVILDRGFACQEVFDLITGFGLDYVVMLKNSATSYGKMLSRYANEIRWHVRYSIDDYGAFGIVDRMKVFANSPTESFVGLFFDGANGTGRSIHFIKKVRVALRTVKSQIAKHEKVTLPDNLKPYLQLVTGEDGETTDVEFNYDAWQCATDSKGFCAIASSRKLSAEELWELYRLRNISEKQFSMMKTELGYDTMRVHSDDSIQSKLAVCFIACVLRTQIELACSRLEFDTNTTIQDVDSAQLVTMTDGQYHFIRNLSGKLKTLFESFGIAQEHFVKFAEEVNRMQTSTIMSPTRVIPDVEVAVKRGRGRPKKAKPPQEDNQPKRRPGRPKGSRNKKTLEREAQLAQQQADQPEVPKRGPGRPKGSRNKKTLEREAAATAALAATKRGRGRPKGSKNKKTLEREALETAAAAAKPHRGRPKGSKNKPKTVSAVEVQESPGRENNL